METALSPDVNAMPFMAPKASDFRKDFRPESGKKFEIVSDYTPAGDQPKAIEFLVQGLADGKRDQVLLGVTGSGKTFTMAHVIQKVQRPTLILAPNKTLAAQLYGEMKSFFPNNAVEYFVSYYDYYTPEAYVPRTDTFIEKESQINAEIERLRHAATRSLLERDDVIIVASVSCIYGIGSPETYSNMTLTVERGRAMSREELIRKLIELHYKRNDTGFGRGTFRVRGDAVELFPAHLQDRAWRISFFGDELESLLEVDPLTGEITGELELVRIYANSHYVTPKPTLNQAIGQIKTELKDRLEDYHKSMRLLEAQRLEQRTTFDLEMIVTTGFCSGIENYSRYLSGRGAGEPPPTLLEYLPDDALLILDESHAMIPQLHAMYAGDKARKTTLSEHGFRLPSCMDNRPLRFEEWDHIRPQTIYVSATPAQWEIDKSGGISAEQLVRPTGLIDPPVEVRPTQHQVDDLLAESKRVVEAGYRVLVTTLTKKMAEALTEYMNDVGLKTRYIHSDTETLERIEIIRDLRLGVYDVLVGINLLREGLDIPECALVAILDADKEGYLRSRTSLVQTIGRAARNVDAKAILYADTVTASMQHAMDETARRRQTQLDYNAAHGITPTTVKKDIGNILASVYETGDRVEIDISDAEDDNMVGKNLGQYLKELQGKMIAAASDLDFEVAARLRDEIKRLEAKDLGLNTPVMSSMVREQVKSERPKKRGILKRSER